MNGEPTALPVDSPPDAAVADLRRGLVGALLLLWAALIVSLTILGFLSFHLGLVVTMPVVGHATWHAYRDLVAPLPRT